MWAHRCEKPDNSIPTPDQCRLVLDAVSLQTLHNTHSAPRTLSAEPMAFGQTRCLLCDGHVSCIHRRMFARRSSDDFFQLLKLDEVIRLPAKFIRNHRGLAADR